MADHHYKYPSTKAHVPCHIHVIKIEIRLYTSIPYPDSAYSSSSEISDSELPSCCCMILVNVVE